ncbi:uncharacterized protein KY384_007280 [Bacidia gigantensis]|uniref:uncharacterized protein n=1 Tax=Bacidia gigantensis TaxID=2732470 RepID=UPI001D04E491|nr:uncharacterized protein KY384_007280 [Bacidia gigantensis]KAG8528362.1 hypothetical protein KY384_007280 [Bacidia gigantensis]
MVKSRSLIEAGTSVVRQRFVERALRSAIRAPKVYDRMSTASRPDYSQWSNEQLIERVTGLENQLKEQTEKYKRPASLLASTSSSERPTKKSKGFDSRKHPTRLIALKLAYLGQNYNGLEFHHGNPTPLPTIEEELWKVLAKSKLVALSATRERPELEPDWSLCDYSKCGRTDIGVSAFGQVLALRVRSNRPRPPDKVHSVDYDKTSGSEPHEKDASLAINTSDNATNSTLHGEALSCNDRSELPYAQMLNRLLPPDIKILACCLNPPEGFSARFSCRERRYKYFFTNPAFPPSPSSSAPGQEGFLNIPLMQAAAAKFTGVHDFRNFCKIDPSKQLENFERRIFHASIDAVSAAESTQFPPPVSSDPVTSYTSLPSPGPTLYTFTLHGSAFLWHQVRHMNPTKIYYDMADDAPLVLWDCIFPAGAVKGGERQTESRPDSLNWIYVGDELRLNGAGQKQGGRDTKYGPHGLVPDLWGLWRKRKIDEVLAGSLLGRVVGMGNAGGKRGQSKMDEGGKEEGESSTKKQGKENAKIFLGGDGYKLGGKYIPVLQRPRGEAPEVLNERWREKRERRKEKMDRDKGEGGRGRES